MGSRISYQVWWTNEYVFWRMGTVILDKKKNIFFDFGEKEEEEVNDFGEKSIVSTNKNHFKKPQKPYIAMRIFNLGKQIYDDTSLIEQAMPLQDGLNKRKRQIDNNASDANGVWIGDSDKISAKEFAQFQGTPGEKVLIPGGAASLARETGRPLPSFVENDMIDNRNEIDNIFGAHSTLRGERQGGREAAASRLVLKQADEGRMGIISRSLESVSSDLYNWWAQLIRLFGAGGISAAGGQDLERRQIKITDKLVPQNVRIRVKSGSLLPKDKDTLKREALELWSRGALDPVTLFEKMGYSNPQESAKRLLLWKMQPMVYGGQYLGLQPPEQKPGGEKPPSLSIRFEDLTPMEQEQALSQVGIQAQSDLRNALFARNVSAFMPSQTSVTPDFAGSKEFSESNNSY